MDTNFRYGVALGLLLLAYVLDALNGRLLQFLVDLTYLAILTFLIFERGIPRRVQVLGGLLMVCSAGSTALYLIPSDPSPTMGVIAATTNVLILALAIGIVVHRISHHLTVNLATVLGAILAYALLGFLFSSVYQGVAIAQQGTAIFMQGQVPLSDYSYFSFVTLTTLGFGDLTPALDLVKRIVVLEALLGQVFLVVLVARLVSLWGRPSAPDSPK